MEGEVESQYNRFHFPWNMNRWYTDMEKADEFLSQRYQYFDEELRDYLDIEEFASAMISCYPNPFSDEIYLRWLSDDGKADEIAIYDVLGRKVFSETLGDDTDSNPDAWKYSCKCINSLDSQNRLNVHDGSFCRQYREQAGKCTEKKGF